MKASSAHQLLLLFRITVIILITALNGTSLAAGKIPLDVFVDDIRKHLYAAGAAGGDTSKSLKIKNVRVELSVIVETDNKGNIGYYVIDGTDSRGLITQKLSFDIELPSTGKGYRTYSTNKAERRFAYDCFGPYRRQPCDGIHDRDMHEKSPWRSPLTPPAISPVIIPKHAR